MYKYFCIILACFVIVSCRSADHVPSDVLPVNTMKKVMWDVLMVDEYANLLYTKDSTLNVKATTLKLYSKVFSLHEISAEEFGKSFSFYKSNPDLEKALMDSLQVYGTKTREEYNLKIPFELPVMR